MSRRLSALFGISKDKEEESFNSSNSHGYIPQGPSTSYASTSLLHGDKLQKQRLALPSDLALESAYSPLEPPTSFRETTAGISSQPSSRPSSRNGPAGHGQSDTDSVRSRPQTPTHLPLPGTASPGTVGTASPTSRGRLSKKSWTSGEKPADRQQHSPVAGLVGESKAWIAGLKEQMPYDLTSLLNGGQSPELWDPNGDVVVYLYPAETQRGPSFRVRSELFQESLLLSYLCSSHNVDEAFQDLSLGRQDPFGPPLHSSNPYHDHSQRAPVPALVTPSRQTKTVCLPLDFDGDVSSPNVLLRGDDVELLVLYRNVFAFLGGGALISTPRQVSLYSIFMGIASILRKLQYTNADGSTWGDIASNSFSRYCDELRLADVRSSREKTVEAIVLGEQMRSWSLYNEGFVHAAGRLQDIKAIQSPKLAKVSPVTLSRLERASLDVDGRLKQLRAKLEDFEFPSMFSGVANSQTATEAKLVRFKAWRAAFIDMRKFTLAQYRRRYGAWPPKASSKKNNFEESGLNRLVVQEMYSDFCDLYDMLANPREMTTRKIDLVASLEEGSSASNETIQHVLRVVLSEYDRSTPPVTPPIPFDTPLIPTFDSSFKGATVLASTAGQVKLKQNELNELLLGSYNREYIKPSAFVQEFIAYERKLGLGATLDQIIDYRCGQWLFIYAVLQTLPMTVVDARDLQFTKGVEHFLFAAPRGGKPWLRDEATSSRAWFNIKIAGRVVSLPSDVLDHQPEGIYARSHCWFVANQWIEDNGLLPDSAQIGTAENSEFPKPTLPAGVSSHHSPATLLPAKTPPRLTPQGSPLVRPETPGSNRRSGIAKSSSYTNLSSIEQADAPVSRTSRPSSTYNPTITFDSILGAADQGKSKKKK